MDVAGTVRSVLRVLYYLIGITFARLENVKCQAIKWQSWSQSGKSSDCKAQVLAQLAPRVTHCPMGSPLLDSSPRCSTYRAHLLLAAAFGCCGPLVPVTETWVDRERVAEAPCHPSSSHVSSENGHP